MLTTNQKGFIAETAVALEAAKLGIGVVSAARRRAVRLHLRPRRDALFACSASGLPRDGDVVVVRCTRLRRAATGFGARATRPIEIDAFAAYCPDNRALLLLPSTSTRSTAQVLQLRLRPTKNNQATGIRWAKDYEFAATLRLAPGPIAQLGERRAGSAKAAGSSPAGSTELGSAQAVSAAMRLVGRISSGGLRNAKLLCGRRCERGGSGDVPARKIARRRSRGTSSTSASADAVSSESIS